MYIYIYLYKYPLFRMPFVYPYFRMLFIYPLFRMPYFRVAYIFPLQCLRFSHEGTPREITQGRAAGAQFAGNMATLNTKIGDK